MLSSARHAKPARPSNVTKQLNNPTASQTATLGFSHKPDRRQFDTQSPTCLRHAPGPFAARLVTYHLLPTLLTTWEVEWEVGGKLQGCAEGLHGDRLRHYVNRVCFGTILNFPNLNTVRKTLAATESCKSCQKRAYSWQTRLGKIEIVPKRRLSMFLHTETSISCHVYSGKQL